MTVNCSLIKPGELFRISMSTLLFFDIGKAIHVKNGFLIILSEPQEIKFNFPNGSEQTRYVIYVLYNGQKYFVPTITANDCKYILSTYLDTI